MHNVVGMKDETRVAIAYGLLGGIVVVLVWLASDLYTKHRDCTNGQVMRTLWGKWECVPDCDVPR